MACDLFRSWSDVERDVGVHLIKHLNTQIEFHGTYMESFERHWVCPTNRRRMQADVGLEHCL